MDHLASPHDISQSADIPAIHAVGDLTKLSEVAEYASSMERGRKDRPRGSSLGVEKALVSAFALFGKRWTGLIMAVLTQGPAYFVELRRAIPKISERMLSDRLSELVEAHLVVREVTPGPPLRVSYRLAEAGQALRPALYELGKWAERYLPESGPHVETDPVEGDLALFNLRLGRSDT